MFSDEVALMQRLHHPNIVSLLGVCMEPEMVMVTEFASFGSLSDVVARRVNREGWHEPVAYQIAAAMSFLHSRTPPIVHRDLNTNNILVYSLGDGDSASADTCVRVADFGLAKEWVRDETMTSFIGSPAFIAPEVLMDKAKYSMPADGA